MTKEYVEMLITVSDPDGVYTLLQDEGYDELADWVAETYFS
jgi:hypothetical protein